VVGAIIGGLVVVVAVAALLTILVIWCTGSTSEWSWCATPCGRRGQHGRHRADRGDSPAGRAVLAEGLKHHLFLGRVLDKVRS